MKNAELERISALLKKATSSEEIFGTLLGTPTEKLATARKVFLLLAKTAHPDTYSASEDVAQANAAFKKLALFWEEAQLAIENGTYGVKAPRTPFTPFTLRTARRQYMLERLLTHGDLCTLYTGTATDLAGQSQVLCKVPDKPEDNDLMVNEARILSHLRRGEGYAQARHFVSGLIDIFPYTEKATGIVRQITVLSYVQGLFSLKEIRDAYPQGVDAKHMAWMWRRLLIALDFAHSNQVIHGSVLPTHVLIQPEQHGLVLIDWSYAVREPATTHEHINAISTAYREWYPAEVFAKEEPQPGLDIFMAALCMIELLGGDPHQRTMPDSVPWQIQHHLKGCTLAQPQQRPQDAGKLLTEFDELLGRLWGKRKFHAFTMPQR